MDHFNDENILTLFEVWYEQEMPRLYRYIFYKVRDVAIAEDLTSIVCERALERLDQYDPARGEIRAWMFGIARNAIRFHLRSLKRRPVQLSLDKLPEIRVQTRPVEQSYQVKEDFRQILERLSMLPERDQDLIALRYGAGLTNQEIARITGMTDNHVAVRMRRAFLKLRQLLEFEGEK